MSGMRTTAQSVIKRQRVSQADAPNPVVFVATKETRCVKAVMYTHMHTHTLLTNYVHFNLLLKVKKTKKQNQRACIFVCFRALRKHLSQGEMRRAARKPNIPVRVKLPLPPRPIPVPVLPSSTSEPIVLED